VLNGINIEKVDEECHYGVVDVCLFCSHVDDKDIITQDIEVASIIVKQVYYYCKNHKTYIKVNSVCSEFSEE
jgi:hypothetical protein